MESKDNKLERFVAHLSHGSTSRRCVFTTAHRAQGADEKCVAFAYIPHRTDAWPTPQRVQGCELFTHLFVSLTRASLLCALYTITGELYDHLCALVPELKNIPPDEPTRATVGSAQLQITLQPSPRLPSVPPPAPLLRSWLLLRKSLPSSPVTVTPPSKHPPRAPSWTPVRPTRMPSSDSRSCLGTMVVWTAPTPRTPPPPLPSVASPASTPPHFQRPTARTTRSGCVAAFASPVHMASCIFRSRRAVQATRASAPFSMASSSRLPWYCRSSSTMAFKVNAANVRTVRRTPVHGLSSSVRNARHLTPRRAAQARPRRPSRQRFLPRFAIGPHS